MKVNNLKDFFKTLNDVNFKYLVQRNFENLPESVEYGEHSDLDLLVYDLTHFLEIFPEAERVFPEPRVRFKMPIGNDFIYIDLRHTGDGYYPRSFENDLLNSRIWNERGFYTPNEKQHLISLAYHVCHHKGTTKGSDYSRYLGDATIDELLVALKESGVGYCEPSDPSVGRYNQYFTGATSIVEKHNDSVSKKQTGFKDYSLIDNEEIILNTLTSVHFPRVVSRSGDILTIEDCGESLNRNNIPKDWKDQIRDIIVHLREKNISHNDIKLDNLLVKNDIIRLIDFGWATKDGAGREKLPQCLGRPNRSPWGPDDSYAMKKVVKQIQSMLEDANAA